jgi:polyisoprenoid-binding protein YceI
VTIHRAVSIACCVSLAACANQARVSSLYTVAGPSQDQVWFTGSSNIRTFTCSAKQVNVSAEAALEDFARTKKDGLPAVKNAALEVPVRSLDCGIGLQNSHLFETLGATVNPSITFVLGNYVVSRDREVRMNGALRIAGVERNVSLHGRVVRAENGQLMLTGDREIDVRDFGVQPPRRFLGLLRVRREVTVHFLVTVRPLIDPLGILTAAL